MRMMPPSVLMDPACEKKSAEMSTLPPPAPPATMLLPGSVMTLPVAFRMTDPFSPATAMVALIEPLWWMVAP